MLSPLELSKNPINRRQQVWWRAVICNATTTLLPRRLICKLPCIFLWTTIVIVLLYKLVPKNAQDLQNESHNGDSIKLMNNNQQDVTVESISRARLQRRMGYDEAIGYTDASNDLLQSNVIISDHVADRIDGTAFARKGKVLILSIHKPSHLSAPPTKSINQERNRRGIDTLISTNSGGINTSKDRVQITLPPHIHILKEILDSHRIEYDVDTTVSGIPDSLLTEVPRNIVRNSSSSSGMNSNRKYSVIIIDNLVRYIRLNRWLRDQLDRHCKTNQIGIIGYVTADAHDEYNRGLRQDLSVADIFSRDQAHTSSGISQETLGDQLPVYYTKLAPQRYEDCVNKSRGQSRGDHINCRSKYQINGQAQILRILKRKSNFVVDGPAQDAITKQPFVSISSNHASYEPLLWLLKPEDARSAVAVLDRGSYDGIRRVIFGAPNTHWTMRVLLLDALAHLSSGDLIEPLERYVQIDIDDIFVGERGIRMRRDDVLNLLDVQRQFAQRIQGGFKFNLGFSGMYYKHGDDDEDAGDEELISRADEFTWFCHFWSHAKAHEFNDSSSLATELEKNLEFARLNKLPIIGWPKSWWTHNGVVANHDQLRPRRPPTYAVAPHHSGVYPIHGPLYEAWRQVLNVRVTSTEEYPHLRPASSRRAFVHDGIEVLPRQTCDLYTHTNYRRQYPGGMGKLDASIRGGTLFATILHNPVNIYMSHMSNYANDRLAPYTFGALIDFLQSNTNLQLKYAPSSPNVRNANAGSDQIELGPARLAQRYFDMFPSDRKPLWTNPCEDKRHLAIWFARKRRRYCSRTPKLLIVGPQKTGTTALHTYLAISPAFVTSRMSPSDFEEVQFFNDKHYFRGVDWYFSRFDMSDGGEDITEQRLRGNASTSQMTSASSTHNRTSGQSQSVAAEHSSDGASADNDNDSDEYDAEQSSRASDDNFIAAGDEDARVYIDKSATYFDDPHVPRRASLLLPDARLVIMLVDPSERAYSWYQHMRAHGDAAAREYTFDQVVSGIADGGDATYASKQYANDSSSRFAPLRALRSRCIHPGFYYQHLARWLEHYPSNQVIIIDGQWFRHHPAAVLNKLQMVLRVEPQMDYRKHLVYDKRKGFYCQRIERTGEIKCLGPSKGRKYPPMSTRARAALDRLYLVHNKQLASLLLDIGQPLPAWLSAHTHLNAHL